MSPTTLKKNKISASSGQKLRVGVLFGGRSAEHEVSLVSAASIIGALDKEKYDVIPIGITPEGKWISFPDAVGVLKSHADYSLEPDRILLPDPSRNGLMELTPDSTAPMQPIDVVFPVLHGTYGEDGTIQGLFELANIAYVGAGVLGSAAGMDKVVAKQLCEHADIPVAPYLWFLSSAYAGGKKKLLNEIEKKLRYPCFVKPSNSGSSVGISKAHNRRELLGAIDLAMEYDRKILVERSIEHAREIEVSVLGNDEPAASLPGEIIPSNEFYDYDAKYVDGKSEAVIPATLPKHVVRKLRELSVRVFKATDCGGMARVDFLVKKKSHTIYFNEINTIPGFTSISMYPKLWEASGLAYPALLDKLIALALERHAGRARLKTTFTPKAEWYKEE